MSSTFVKLSKTQLEQKYKFIENYKNASNAASGSEVDANANVASKNVATLAAECQKDFNVQLKRYCITKKIEEMWGKDLADEYNRQIENHEIYVHDESHPFFDYCASVTMYPFLLNGLKGLGGESVAPKHLESFCGGFINLVFALSSQLAGACSTVEFLLCFDYFARKDYGDNYLDTNKKDIENALQQVVYSINQPASARGYQCVREDTTQLFTPEGFKYLRELKEGDTCYVWKNGKLDRETIKKLNVHSFNGDLYQFKGNNYQQTVTPNHRVLYKVPNTHRYDIKEAKDLFNKSKISCPIACNNNFDDFQISDDMIQLCAAVLCDGTIDTSNDSPRIVLYLSKNRWGYKNIPSLLEKNGIGFTLKDITTNSFGDMVSLRIPAVDSASILRFIKHTKKELPHWTTLLSQRQARLFVETWSKFDGQNTLKKERKVSSNTKNNIDQKYLLQADNENIADSLQHICFLAGLGSKKYVRTFNKFGSDEMSNKPTFYVETFKRKDKRVKEYNKIHYEGNVWCPTTDAGIVIFREDNNIPYISGNSVFWNISIFDKYYFDSLFGDFVFPDMSTSNWESVSKLQKFFMNWFNEERRKALLTFPVVTAALVYDKETKNIKDEDFLEMCAEQDSKGNSFFKYESDSVDSLSSCCRLRSELNTENTFSFSLGAGGVQAGSINVITINLNRLVQNAVKANLDIKDELRKQVQKIHKYQVSTKAYYKGYLDADMLPLYSLGYLNLDKKFLTIGINGLLEAAEFMGIRPVNDSKYKEFTSGLLKIIYDEDKEAKTKYGTLFNCEFVPAENLGVKNYNWDKKDGYVVPEERNCYNSYLYRVEDIEIDPIDKFFLHGRDNLQYLDGGSALHLNLEEYPTKEAYKKLYSIAAKTGCNYWTTNVAVTCCEEPECGYIDKRTLNKCSKCGSTNVTHATRIIGYLKKVKSFSKERQKEADRRYYAKVEEK